MHFKSRVIDRILPASKLPFPRLISYAANVLVRAVERDHIDLKRADRIAVGQRGLYACVKVLRVG
jgi:hypothetical protein